MKANDLAAVVLVVSFTQMGITSPAASAQPEASSAWSAITITVRIEAQPLGDALNELARQTGLQVVYFSDVDAGLRSPRVAGTFSAAAALERILADTTLGYEFIDSRTIAIREPEHVIPEGAGKPTTGEAAPAAGFRLAQSGGIVANAAAGAAPTSEASSTAPASAAPGADSRGVPEVLIRGSKILNMDIARSRDDAQPYVIFGREAIEQSGLTNIQDFLKQRLAMNTAGRTSDQSPVDNRGNLSQVNLRGLGANQTLVLLDGHRVSSAVAANAPLQPDMNAIPLAAVERIEVLPTTASGIYGGSATGGVINVVLRRDYRGVESKASYENTFASDSAVRRVDAAAGLNFQDGRTNLLMAASYADANPLMAGERGFAERGRATVLANNPASFYAASAPPLGATPNIRSASGANLVLKSGTALKSPITTVPAGYAGAASDGGAALIAGAGTYNFSLADSAQYFGNSGGARQTLVSAPTTKSVTATLRHRFSSNVQAFVDAGASSNASRALSGRLPNTMRVAAAAPNNPFVSDVIVAFPSSEADSVAVSENTSLRGVAGVVIGLPRDWISGIDYTWSRSTYWFTESNGIAASALSAAVSNGTVDVLRDTERFPVDLSPYLTPTSSDYKPGSSLLEDATLRVSGPLAALPAGAATLSAALERRDERIGEGHLGSLFIFPDTSQTVTSAYVELRVPLASELNRRKGLHELELQVAGRYDRYKTEGANLVSGSAPASARHATNEVKSVNPTVAVQYRPFADVAFRASYGTGFLPPSVNQLVPSNSTGGTLVDPKRGNSLVSLPLGSVTTGGNSALEPEESKSWSAGFLWTPRSVPSLRFSVDYVRIEKSDNIAAPGNQVLADNEALFPGRVVRGAKLPTDPADWAGPIVALDNTLANFAHAEVSAYDVSFDYSARTERFGTFSLFSIATWQPHYRTQFLESSPVVENVGVTHTNPLKLKANAALTWNYRQWTAGWSTRYFHSYFVANPNAASSAPILLDQGSMRVSSQTYHDVFVSHAGLPRGWMPRVVDSLEVTLGIKNVFGTAPPFDANGSVFSYVSPLGDPRLASYYLTLKMAF